MILTHVRSALLIFALVSLSEVCSAEDVIIGSIFTNGLELREPGPMPRTGPQPGQSVIDSITRDMVTGRASNAQVTAELSAARINFFSLYPDKPGLDKARKEFSRQLFARDLLYYSLYLGTGVTEAAKLQVRGILALGAGGQIGGGLDPADEQTFVYWIDAARRSLGVAVKEEQSPSRFTSNGGPPPPRGGACVGFGCARPDLFVATPEQMIRGITDTQSQYESYVRERDQRELANFNRLSRPRPAPRPPAPPVASVHDLTVSDLVKNGDYRFVPSRERFDSFVLPLINSHSYQILECRYAAGFVYLFWMQDPPPKFKEVSRLITFAGDLARLLPNKLLETTCPVDPEVASRMVGSNRD